MSKAQAIEAVRAAAGDIAEAVFTGKPVRSRRAALSKAIDFARDQTGATPYELEDARHEGAQQRFAKMLTGAIVAHRLAESLGDVYSTSASRGTVDSLIERIYNQVLRDEAIAAGEHAARELIEGK